MAQPRPQNQVDQDIAIIVGGSFSPDHIGPTAHQQIVRRVRAAPDQYLQAFERRFLRSGVDPLDLADLYLPVFLQLLADRAPQQTHALGARLAAVYSSAIPRGAREDWEALDGEGEPDEPTRKRRRLEQHLATLGAITGRR
jgi:hypothetical protein